MFGLIDFILRLIPEGFIIMLAGYAYANKQINPVRYIASSITQASLTYLFRLLPISNVMPMILSAVTAVVIHITVNKIVPFKAIISTLVCFVLTVVYETINMLVLNHAFGIDINKVFFESDSLTKNIYGLPSLALFALTIIICFFILRRKRRV